jgi:hypothetical protein
LLLSYLAPESEAAEDFFFLSFYLSLSVALLPDRRFQSIASSETKPPTIKRPFGPQSGRLPPNPGGIFEEIVKSGGKIGF